MKPTSLDAAVAAFRARRQQPAAAPAKPANKMKRASYREAIALIADNVEDGSEDRLDADVVAFYESSVIVAGIFGVEPERVGRDVVRYRTKNG